MMRISAAIAIPAVLLAGEAHPVFIDVAPHSRLTYVTNNDLSARKYFIQPMGGGVALFDFDNDGKLDIFFTNGAKLPELVKTGPAFYNCLLRNKGDGTFEDVTRRAGLEGADLGYNLGVAVGDYDNDGYEDLFIAGTRRNALFHNNGNGTFTEVPIPQPPPNTLTVAAAWIDYDGDGLLDLFTASYTLWGPLLDKRCSANGVEYYCTPVFYPAVPNRLYHNLGRGKFEDVTEKSGLAAAPGKGMGISIADFNGDGKPDIFVANDTEANALFINKGDGAFEDQALPLGAAYDDSAKAVSSMGSDANDFDNDGRPDIFYNDLMNQFWALLRNNGDEFRNVSQPTQVAQQSVRYSGWSAGFIDYNNDGWKDIYSANGDVDNLKPDARQHDTMFENQGGKKFADVSEAMGPDFLRTGFQRGAAFGDLNNDGRMDIVVTSLNERPRILINQGATGNHWLLLKLVGHKSNRDAIGATVKLTTASGRVLYNHVSISVGFMSSSDKRVHFGLGPEKEIKSLEIHWPSGLVQQVAGLKADEIVEINEEGKP